jgi:S-formylglutathione hydrolase FrmB
MSRVAFLILPLAIACGSSPAPKPTTTTTAPPPATTAAPPAPIVIPTATGTGKVETHTFHSDALGVDKSYVVYLPGGYSADPAARWPVLYYLHGLGGNETNWTELGDLAGAADQLHLAAIVVMPDGDDGFYTNAAAPRDYDACLKDGSGLFDPREDRATTCVRSARYEDYIVKDLIAHVDGTYATIADRRARGIAGLSMGGFGALALAMRHPDLFSAAASHSGVDALLYEGPHPYEAGKVQLVEDVASWGKVVEPIGAWVRAIFGTNKAMWQAHDPAFLAAQLAPGTLALYLDCGTEDIFLLNDAAAYLHDVLTARGIAHSYYIGPGRHDFDFWRQRVGHSLAFFAAHFAGTPPPVEAPAPVEAEAPRGTFEVKIIGTLAGEGLSVEMVQRIEAKLPAAALACAAKTTPAGGNRELALGITAEGELADLRWLAGAKADAFADCLAPAPPSSLDDVRYLYVVLSITTSGQYAMAAPAAPTFAGDLAEVCDAKARSGAKDAGNAANLMGAYIYDHVRHPDVLAMLHQMGTSDPRQKTAVLKAALAKARIPLAKCPLARQR